MPNTNNADLQLLEAARLGDLSAIKESLQNGADLRMAHGFSGSEYRSAIHWAIANGHTKVASRLLDVTIVDLEEESSSGNTPFVCAAGKGELEILLKLKSLGANIEHRNKDGQSAFDLACKNKHFDVAGYLLNFCHCDPNIMDGQGRYPLHTACDGLSDNRMVVKLLLANKANIHARTLRGFTPLQIAAGSDNGSPSVIRLLLHQGARLEDRNDLNQTAFDIAAGRGKNNTQVCHLLLTTFRDQLVTRFGPIVLHEILKEAVYLSNQHVQLDGIGTLTMEWFGTLLRSFDTEAIRSRDPVTRFLPMHVACSCGAPADVLRMLTELDPAALRTTSEVGLRAPLGARENWLHHVSVGRRFVSTMAAQNLPPPGIGLLEWIRLRPQAESDARLEQRRAEDS